MVGRHLWRLLKGDLTWRVDLLLGGENKGESLWGCSVNSNREEEDKGRLR